MRIYEFSDKKIQSVCYNSGAGGASTPAHVQNHTPRGAHCQATKVFLFMEVGLGWHGVCCASNQRAKC